jgi:hypothetical protein
VKRTASERASTISTDDYSVSTENIEGSGRPAGNMETGYVHLLKNHTLDDVLGLLEEKPRLTRLVMGFLKDGIMPMKIKDERRLLEWFLFNQEPDIFLACLALAKIDSLVVNKKNEARTLLEAVQSREFTASVNLTFECTHDNLYYGMFGAGPEEEPDEFPDHELMDLLSAILRVNNGLKNVSIVFDANSDEYLVKLTQALACIENLEFEASSSRVTLNQLGILTEMVSKNDHLKSFRVNLTPKDASPDNRYTHDSAVNLFLKSIDGQQRLEHLFLHGVPEAAQNALGDLIVRSERLTRLDIALETTNVKQPLLIGLCQNTAIQSLTLKVANIEDAMLPLINLFADNRLGVREFKLETVSSRSDKNDFKIISKMISSNLSISSFSWTSKFSEGVDFAVLGLALKNNRSLEALELNFANPPHESGQVEEWLHGSGQIPTLVKLLSKNVNLTSFVLSAKDLQDNDDLIEIQEIAAILHRNRSYRDYACSRNFVCAAASSFFHPYGMAAELAEKIAEDLLQRGPRILAGSLALVNKATYAFASEFRQSEASEAVRMALANGQSADEGKAKMVELLRCISVSQGDFSDQTLCQIAANPYVAYALNTMASENPEAAGRLKNRLVHAAGAELVERQFRLEAEQSNEFESDQENSSTDLSFFPF